MSWNHAFARAGAIGGTATSPIPPRFSSPLGIIDVVMEGVSFIKSIRVFEKFRLLATPLANVVCPQNAELMP